MSVAERNSYSEFNQSEVCEYDESWVLQLLKECDFESEASFISDEELDRINLLNDDIIRIENQESSIPVSNKPSNNSLSAIQIQKMQMRKIKKFAKPDVIKKEKSSKTGSKLRALLKL